MILFRIKYDGFPPRVPRREINDVIRACLTRMGETWHRAYRPKHFTRAGAKEYGYTPRKGEGLHGRAFWKSYMGRKQRQKRHQRPLVWSGESELRSRVRDVRATSKRVRIVLRTPTLNYRNKHSKINMAEEMRTVSRKEEQALTHMFDLQLSEGLRRLSGKQNVLIA